MLRSIPTRKLAPGAPWWCQLKPLMESQQASVAASMPRWWCLCRPALGRTPGWTAFEVHTTLMQKLPEHSGNLSGQSPLCQAETLPRPLLPPGSSRVGRKGHSLPPRVSLNDNQLLPGGHPGLNPGTQALDLLRATNQIVNVGPPASLLPQEPQHPGLVLGGKGSGLREPQARPTPQPHSTLELGRDAKPCLPLGNQTSPGLPTDLKPLHH